jgi:hypothetical protein
MKKTALFSAAVLSCILLNTMPLSACGDKLLYLSRIYHHHGSANNTVAIFARPNSLLENVASLKLEKVFHEDGYHLLLVNSDRDLAMALQSGAADVVIADIADAAALEQAAQGSKIPIIPVISKDDAKSITSSKHFLAVIKSPVKPDKFLDALDRAFDSKEMRLNRSKMQSVSFTNR